jgi:hypothetical protein
MKIIRFCVLGLLSSGLLVRAQQINPNQIQQSGASLGQALSWNGLQWAPENGTLVNAINYNWPAQTPGGGLTASQLNTVTLSPCPLGVNGGDTNLRFYISGGTGSSESVADVGGTCTSGAATGTVTFTPVNNHSGAWTISSSLLGIYEAVAANPYREVRIPAGTYFLQDCLNFNPNQSLILTGDGYDPAGVNGTILAFANVTSTCNAISILNSSGFPIDPITIRNMLIVGSGGATPVSDGIYLQDITRVTLDNIMVSGFAGYGIFTNNAFEVIIQNHTYVQDCGQYGIFIQGVANLVSITDTSLGFNGRTNGNGNIEIDGSSVSPTAVVFLKGLDSESAGQSAYSGTNTTGFGLVVAHTSSFTMISSWFENNLGGSPSAQVVYGAGMQAVTEIGNNIAPPSSSSVGISYGSDTVSVTSYGNTFYGATASRFFNAASLASYVVGPDYCLNSSPECTSHPRILGMSGSTGSTAGALGSNCPAVTCTAPYVWLKTIGPDGSTLYSPWWK